MLCCSQAEFVCHTDHVGVGAELMLFVVLSGKEAQLAFKGVCENDFLLVIIRRFEIQLHKP